MSKDRLREQLRKQRGGADPVFSRGGRTHGGGSLLIAKLVRTLTGLARIQVGEPLKDYGALREAATRLDGGSAAFRMSQSLKARSKELAIPGSLVRGQDIR